MRTTFTVVMAAVLSNFAYAQVGINTANPITSLDVVAKNGDGSTAEGILPPRMTGDQLQAADSRYTPAHAGTIIYITSAVSSTTSKTANITSPGLYYFDGGAWNKVMLGDEKGLNRKNIGDIKSSVKTSDHNGWYLLDGRSLSLLSPEGQASAESLGFTNNLPDATDRVLKSKASNEIPGTVGGNNYIAIKRENLPNINLSGTVEGIAQAAGAHTHTPTEGGFLLGGTMVNNNGTNNYQGDGNSFSWGGIGMIGVTGSSGTHMHNVTGSASVPTGGSGTNVDNRSAYLVVNTFIYLGG